MQIICEDTSIKILDWNGTEKLVAESGGYYADAKVKCEGSSDKDIDDFSEITLENCNFEEFLNDIYNFSSLTKIKAEEVGFFKFEIEGIRKLKSIEHMSLAHNNIKNMSIFKYFSSLTFLDISYNDIIDIKLYNEIKHLNLSHNKIEQLPVDKFIDSLEIIDLSYNKIKTVNFNSKHSMSIKSLNLQKNGLEDFTCHPGQQFEVLDISENNMSSLLLDCDVVELNVNGNNLHTLELDESLKRIHAANNKISDVTFIGNPTPEMIDISANILAGEELQKIFNITTLKVLKISNYVLNKLDNWMFSRMSQLEELYLKNANISEIEHNSFLNLDNLKVLDLSQNKLKFFNVRSQTTLPELRELHLNSNPLEKVENYDSLKTLYPKLEQISIDAHKYECSEWNPLFKKLRAMKLKVNAYGVCRNSPPSTTTSPPGAIPVPDNEVLEQKINEILKIVNDLKSDISEIKTKINNNLSDKRM